MLIWRGKQFDCILNLVEGRSLPSLGTDLEGGGGLRFLAFPLIKAGPGTRTCERVSGKLD